MRNLLAIPLIIISMSTFAQTYQPTWESIDSRPTPQWFTDAKFGIFIHWGVFSVPSWGPLPRDGASIYECYAEWYWSRLMNTKDKAHHFFKEHHDKTYGADFKYQDFVNDFTCEMFDPDQWAKVFKTSGAKYVVLTSKHHEGFTLWPSAQSWNWNAVDAGPHRDLAGDLINAVRKEGLRMGYYYSLYEWFNPLYHSDVNAYVDQHMIPQMKDLVTRYKPDVLWTDGEWDHPSETWKSTQFLSWLYNESPVKNDVVINDRWGKETRSVHGGIYTTEYDLIHDASSSTKKIDHPWEECRGIGSSFGYNRNENLADYNSSFELIRILIDKVARGGNLLLNIGPTADGRIPVIMQQRLSDMGGWLSVNGEAIYGTSAWEKSTITKDQKVFYTRKGKDLYVLCTEFPEKGIEVPFVQSAQSVTMLGIPGNLKFSKSNSGIKVSLPENTSSFNKLNYAWVFKLAGALK
jgi:alpha-L-fucosidase